jgi:hypothetical protein
VRREAEADARGHYTWTDLLSVVYDITVAVSGSKPFTQKLSVLKTFVTNTSFNLPVGSVCQMVTVREFEDGRFYPKSECQAQPEADLSLVILSAGDRQRITAREMAATCGMYASVGETGP